ncbi:DUF1513 domain-containing protein [Aquincola sp. S2]|uniref:DUF1513 domain-containing protein n=1 Tax=Pseudaquabacterium terrae TaxID=2732868 RepID=A0ABX2EQY4_9BURK|nr:DUF1513 domain-containing protein [Aquabacterium terrae]NRF70979.1 DUF1513 domain-containing protein [Aquabacterium terrae]
MPLRRRDLLPLASLALAGPWLDAAAAAESPPPAIRLAAGWRSEAAAGEAADRVGIIEVDWAKEQVRLLADLPAPGRVHGVVALPDGGFVAVATRPGHWLLRCDAEGRVVARVITGQEFPGRTFNGHVTLSHDGQWLFTTETSSPTGMSWVSVRDVRNLHRIHQFLSAGFDAHQCLLDDDGNVFIANGGILRAEDGRKIDLDRMRPSLAHIDPDSTEVLGQWRLQDQRLSIRHLAWSQQADGKRVLGVGLQAEHDDPSRRREAPVLALWRGAELSMPSADAQAAGYVGDIALGPMGGFILSGQKAARGLWWHPRAARTMTKVAELIEACALASLPLDGVPAVLIGSARGIAFWHPTRKPRMLAWPKPMLPDNHWALLARQA